MFVSRIVSRGILMAGLLGMMTIGCGTKDSPDPVKPGPTTATDPKPVASDTSKTDIAKAKPDVAINVKIWMDEWIKDNEAAKKKYQGKVIELSGQVASVSDVFPFLNYCHVTLTEEGDSRRITCLTVDSEPWSKVSPGSKVKIRGVSETGAAGERAELSRCVIVEAGPNPGIRISAQQLAKEFAADRMATNRKYTDKWLYVEGELLRKEAKEKRFPKLVLKGEGDIQIICDFGSQDEKWGETLKSGDRVKLLGAPFFIPAPEQKEISLNSCKLITSSN